MAGQEGGGARRWIAGDASTALAIDARVCIGHAAPGKRWRWVVVIRRGVVHRPGERDWIVRISIVVIVDQVAVKIGSASFLI